MCGGLLPDAISSQGVSAGSSLLNKNFQTMIGHFHFIVNVHFFSSFHYIVMVLLCVSFHFIGLEFLEKGNVDVRNESVQFIDRVILVADHLVSSTTSTF